jgi:hypothetical protein
LCTERSAETDLARFPIGWTHPIDKNSRKISFLSIFFSPNRFHFGGICSSPDISLK